jgi:hypothetical protein
MSLWPWCGPMSCGQCVREGSACVFQPSCILSLTHPIPQLFAISNDNVAAISTQFRAICHWVNSQAGCHTCCTLPRRGSGNFPKPGELQSWLREWLVPASVEQYSWIWRMVPWRRACLFNWAHYFMRCTWPWKQTLDPEAPLCVLTTIIQWQKKSAKKVPWLENQGL